MGHANISDRRSIERIYPRDLWESDAGFNSQGCDSSRRGVLIVTAVGSDGEVHVRRAVRHVGEGIEESHGIFICPYLGRAYDIFEPAAGVHGAVVEKHDALEDISFEYAAFIDAVVAAAARIRVVHLAPQVRLPKG